MPPAIKSEEVFNATSGKHRLEKRNPTVAMGVEDSIVDAVAANQVDGPAPSLASNHLVSENPSTPPQNLDPTSNPPTAQMTDITSAKKAQAKEETGEKAGLTKVDLIGLVIIAWGIARRGMYTHV